MANSFIISIRTISHHPVQKWLQMLQTDEQIFKRKRPKDLIDNLHTYKECTFLRETEVGGGGGARTWLAEWHEGSGKIENKICVTAGQSGCGDYGARELTATHRLCCDQVCVPSLHSPHRKENKQESRPDLGTTQPNTIPCKLQYNWTVVITPSGNLFGSNQTVVCLQPWVNIWHFLVIEWGGGSAWWADKTSTCIIIIQINILNNTNKYPQLIISAGMSP